MKHKETVSKYRILKELFLGLIILGTIGVGGVLLWVSTFTMPDLSSFSDRKVSESTKIYDRTGKVLLYDLNQGTKRTNVADSEISINVKNATVAIEDSDFYEHHGIKITSIFRAIIANIFSRGYSQGGSTITQQVVKNSLLTTEKKISRKLKEWVLALKLERVLNKTEILDIYLNEAPYGGTIYGIEEASQTYFGKKALDLSLAESAYLSALPNAPSYYSPYGNNKQRLEDRKNLVLSKMLEKKFITQEEYDKAKAEKVAWRPQENTGIKAPHFVMYIRQYLEEKYGKSMIEQGGLKVTTTLDYGLQAKAEELANKYALENEKNYNAENASIVALDPKTGQILVMVGSRNYFDKNIDGNFNVALAHRQPGSSFKPIVYAEAFIKGYTPDTAVFDLQTEFSSECNPDGTPIVKGDEKKCYMPENYDHVYRGPISFRNALAQSINVPAIKALYLAGLKDSLRLAKDMGIKSLTNTNQYGLTLVLGGGEVSLLDMSSAYGTFAANGVRNPYQGILKVEDKNGTVLEQFEPHPIEVMPEQVALMISDVLSDNKARTPAFGEHSALYIEDRPVAVKTGTTNDYRDAWIMGYTPNLVVGAWAGNNDNSPMEKKVAGFIIAPLWNAFIKEALKQYPVENFKKPDPIDKSTLKPALAGFWQGGKAYFVNKLSGEKATDATPPELREERVIKQIHSILFWVDKDNPAGPAPVNPDQDPQFKLWEYPIRKWVTANNVIEEGENVIPVSTDSMHGPESIPTITISNPISGTLYPKNQNIVITVNTSGRFPISKVDYFINGAFVGSATRAPWSFSFLPRELDTLRTENELKAIVYDTAFNRSETKITFNIASSSI
jgi:1A family penicillin-binding protein